MSVLLPLAMLQAVASAVFAPPTDRTLRVVTTTVRDDAGISRSFSGERRVRFVRTQGGYSAAVTLVASSAQTPDPSGGMFASAFAALAGKTLSFELDRHGRVVDVADQASLWETLCDSIARLAPAQSPSKAATARQLAATLRGFSAERQRALLASLLTPLIDTTLAAEAPGTRTVRLPGRAEFGTAAMLEGTQQVTRDGALLRAEIAAEGPTPTGRTALAIVRRVDPATGLLVDSSNSVTVTLGEGAAARRATSVTTIRIDSPVS